MKNKTQEVAHHPVLKTITRFFAVIFLVCFIILFVATTLSATLNATLLKKSFVQSQLIKESTYEDLTEQADVIYKDVAEVPDPFTHEERVRILRNVLPFSEYQNLLTTTTDEVFALLHGQKAQPTLSYNLTPLQGRLAEEYIRIMPELKVCTEDQEDQFFCRPKDFDVSELRGPNGKARVMEQVRDLVPTTLSVDSLTQNDALDSRIRDVQGYYAQFQLGLVAATILMIIFLALATAAFWLPWRRSLEVPGIALAFMGGLLTACGIVMHIMVGRIPFGDTGDVISQVAVTTSLPFVTAVIDRFTLLNAIFFAIGMVLFVLALVLSRHHAKSAH